VTTPALADGISGVILCAETFGQRLADGTPFPVAIANLGMRAGVRADCGRAPLPGGRGAAACQHAGLVPIVAAEVAMDGEHSLGQCAAEVASATMEALACVPPMLAGVAFRSGEQSPERATANLAALQRPPHLWPLTFSFGRALAGPALLAWGGLPCAVQAGQRALARRLALNVAALHGRYTPQLELPGEEVLADETWTPGAAG
jgi:fructose-bisphosphate aldolase, class I